MPSMRGEFQETLRGLKCVKCKTTPNKYYIDFWWKGERIRVFLDEDGNPGIKRKTVSKTSVRLKLVVLTY